jgi:hypothetical protein
MVVSLVDPVERQIGKERGTNMMSSVSAPAANERVVGSE